MVGGKAKKSFCCKPLGDAGFVRRWSGSFVDSPGSIVESVGSLVDSPGSFVGGCRGICNISGGMSRNLRHHESLCRGIRNILVPAVAVDATTRAEMLRQMRQPKGRAVGFAPEGGRRGGAGPLL
jgi:hypothetical protein